MAREKAIFDEVFDTLAQLCGVPESERARMHREFGLRPAFEDTSVFFSKALAGQGLKLSRSTLMGIRIVLRPEQETPQARELALEVNKRLARLYREWTSD